MGTRNIQENLPQQHRDSRDPYQALLNLNSRYSYMGTDDELEEVRVDTRKKIEVVIKKTKSSSLILHPFGRVFNCWLFIVSVTVLYNWYLITARTVFWKLENLNPTLWFVIDYICDGIYILDMIFHTTTGYVNDDGVLETDVSKTFKKYAGSKFFALDVFSILPTDALYAVLGTSCPIMLCPVIVRLNRLARFHRIPKFFFLTILRTRFFLFFRICEMSLYISIIIHVNACAFFAMSYFMGFGSDLWTYPYLGGSDGTLTHEYLYSIYWSTRVLVSLSSDTPPQRTEEYLFMVFDQLLSVVVFAAILGNVTSIISNSDSRRNKFRARINDLRDYFKSHKVDDNVQFKILRWYTYMYRTHQPLHHDHLLDNLQEDLQAQLILSMNKELLQSVDLFKGASEAFLNDVCLKFKLKAYCPGDYVCRKGDVNKEMFVVKSGQLLVEDSDDYINDIYTQELQEARYFGDLNVIDGYGKKNGYRRMASVRSVGYSQLYCLTKKDLGDVLDEHTEVKSELVQKSHLKLMKLGMTEDPTSPSIDMSQSRIFY